MKAGRSLDALVARQVMGLDVRFERGHENGWKGDPYADREEERQPVTWWPNDWIVLNEDGAPREVIYLPGGYGPELVRPYSTDIAAAWEVVEKFKEDGRAYVVGWDGDEHWADVQIDGRWNEVCHADTAPHAICFAALKAVGVEVPE